MRLPGKGCWPVERMTASRSSPRPRGAATKCHSTPVVPVQRAAARGRQVACPADVAVRMADVTCVADAQQADESRSAAPALAARDVEIDHVADPEAMPEAADERIDQGENSVLETEDSVPERRSL